MELILTSIIAFVSTNIDDIFLLILFFGNKKFTSTQIVSGQLLGISTLVIISLTGSFVGLLVNPAYVGLLGLFPIYLGVRELWEMRKSVENSGDDENINPSKTGMLAVAGVTIANGGDNIGIYIPLFTTLTWTSKSIMIGIFLAMTLLWCAIARYLTTHPLMATAIEKYGKRVAPIVLILLGIYILYENETFGLINNFLTFLNL
jgi:cadmium resistance transport/sequestration family protein